MSYSEQAVLQLKNVTKKIGTKTIIDDLSLEVPRGEVFGFLGPNGAGKTTTIRMIVGLMAMTKGEIIVDGISVKHQFEHAMSRVGAIVENPEMYKFLTGYQNLIHYARMNQRVTRERINEVVELVGMNNRIHEKVKRYSLGMRQRLGIAQAILHKPSLLILDEPTNGLDPAGIRELRDYLRSLAKNEGISVLVSSHLLSEMELMCDEVAIIQGGKLVDIRSIQNVKGEEEKSRYAFEVDHSEKARDAIVLQLSENDLSVVNNHVEISLHREQIPDVISTLVQAGVKIYSVRAITKTLEDQFLEMTRSEQIV